VTTSNCFGLSKRPFIMNQGPLLLHTFNHLKQVYANNYDNMNFLRRWQLEPTEDESVAVSGRSNQQILKRYAGAQ
jgi:hypothetical protein